MTKPDDTSGFSQFLAEMRRRHVVRFALGYAAAAFVILQLAEIVFPAFGIGEGGLRVLVVVTALGFPPSLVLAWVYDLTTEGVKRTAGGETKGPVLPRVALLALLVATVGVTGALGAYLAQQGVFDPVAAGPASRSLPLEAVSYEPGTPIQSLAVLPLDDFSPGGDQAYFAAGMHEELIAKLSMLEGVRVVSRTSVMQYAGTTLAMPQIGRELNVDVVVEGSVTRTAERTRVTLQIIHAPSDSHIETLQWDREEVQDVLAFHTEVAHGVVHEIDTSHEETLFASMAANVEPAAQDAYFKGKYEYERGTPDGNEMALEYFKEAVEQDPDFAPAMAGLAGARFLIGIEDPDMVEEEISMAHDEARAALALDSTSVEALEVLAFIERSMPRIRGEEPVIPAPASAPKTVHVMTMSGGADSIVLDMSAFDTAWVSATTTLGERIEEQVRRRTATLERDGGGRGALEARQFMSSGRYAEASRLLEGIVEDNPEMDQAWDMLARSRVASGDAEAAADVVAKWHESDDPRAPDENSVARLEDAVRSEGARGYWAWTLDRATAADAEGRPVPRMEFASAHAALGNVDEALRFLFQALERSEPGIMAVRSDPVWDDVRSDPRFRQFAREAQSLRFSPTRRPNRRPSGNGR